uniref:Uncharacterized protein n=1 Tax=Megaselia scalaris TaxID=36166 RepID=T1GYE9_MEGSC
MLIFEQSSKTTSTSVGNSSQKTDLNECESNIPRTVATQANQREIRHLKMFYILISLMAAFIVLRLPAWIFLIMRMYGDYTQPVDWILHFVFGILTLAS